MIGHYLPGKPIWVRSTGTSQRRLDERNVKDKYLHFECNEISDSHTE